MQIQRKPNSEIGILLFFLETIANKIDKSLEISKLALDESIYLQKTTLSSALSLVEEKLEHRVKSIEDTISIGDTVTYLDIDSTYRNRKMYPLSSSFIIPFCNNANGQNAFISSDPVSNSTPIEEEKLQLPLTLDSVTLSPNSSSIDNFYIGKIIEIGGLFRIINNYNSATKLALLNNPLPFIPGAGDSYIIRNSYPIITDTLLPGSTQTFINLPLSASSIDEIYTGNFLRLKSSGESRIITNYIGGTRICTVSPGFSSSPAGGEDFEIDEFSYDNCKPLNYSGSKNINQPVCYSIQLLQLSIPRQVLDVGYGGTVLDYPYVYVHIYNDNRHSDTTMYGNNPNGKFATFKVSFRPSSITPFFYKAVSSDIYASPMVMKFSPIEAIRFRVTLPSGEDLSFVEKDTESPSAPNPLLQISAMFGIRRGK